MYKMPFKQFLFGGYTSPRQLGQNDLDIWDKVLALPNIDHNISAKGTPTSVQTAVVSGFKFKFAFEDGSTVVVWKSWRNVISIIND